MLVARKKIKSNTGTPTSLYKKQKKMSSHVIVKSKQNSKLPKKKIRKPSGSKKYTPKPNETIFPFNDRFTDYLHTIQTKFYTKEWDIWWKLVQVKSKPDYLELMKETEKLFRLKIQAQNLSPVPPTSASSTIPTVPASFSALFVSSAKLNSTSTTFFSIGNQPSSYIKGKKTVSDSKNKNIMAQTALQTQ
ncbi:hypothetical protein BB559_002006 [Furculomyces boomerangus]|uniref:Uncharacterized protein n=1 Tax=Furculomyces boomerangus TaxID=61424 RepID=A0A2T9YYY2_9FUNG|nr:hypothetical protein BB559_002006 [Furculomyces boomerangus]